MEMGTTLLLILSSVSINSVAQIVWKKGADKLGKTSITRMLFKPRIMIGLILYAFSALLWIIVLSNAEVSYAFPFISLGYVITTLLSYLILKEQISKKRILGLSVIITGVVIVGLSL